MEILDIYDRDGKKKGITVFRGEYIKSDDFILVSHVYIYNSKNEFLIQRRSWKKKVNSGKWDITGGAVKASESSRQGAIRETKEEIGLIIPEEKLKFVHRHVSIKHIVDIYFAKVDFNISDCILQKEEVAEVKLVEVNRLMEILKRSDFQDNIYNEVINKILEGIIKGQDPKEGNKDVNFTYNEKVALSIKD